MSSLGSNEEAEEVLAETPSIALYAPALPVVADHVAHSFGAVFSLPLEASPSPMAVITIVWLHAAKDDVARFNVAVTAGENRV